MPEPHPKQQQQNTFDLANSPLDGFNLIDASAGTGKTYTICALVLRLILEKHLNIDQILVVTYTEAATEDLRDRIRQKLRQALQALTYGEYEDSFLQQYIPLIKDNYGAEQRISDALRGFDEAAIFTIHGFCQRMLLENSFESNTLFDTELVADDSTLLREIAEDFWRRNFYRESDIFVQYAADKISPTMLHNFLETLLPQPLIQFIPAESEDCCAALTSIENDYIEAYRAVCTAWPNARPEVGSDLLNSDALNRNTYRIRKISGILSAMDAMAAFYQPSTKLFDGFSLMTRSTITAKTKSKHTPKILPFYEICENLQQILNLLVPKYELCLLAKKKKLADSFRNECNKRKERMNIFSFDDLLRKLHAALSGPTGVAFARTIAEKYHAVLIDEFQDTDPLQFEIFTTICRGKSSLFLIGDPKQAIYSFRGADIFTYMDAAVFEKLSSHTLDINHRSIPGLVNAINTLFSRVSRPFVFDAIAFHPVAPAPHQEKKSLTINGRQESPFILWFVDNNETPATKEKLTKAEARQCIIAAVAAEVTTLLALAAENRACIDDRKLLPGDIAILVRKNDEARKMQEALTANRVPSVLHSGDNLFATWEAQEMGFLLGGIVAFQNLPRVRAALLTSLIGVKAAEIDPLAPNSEPIIEKWLLRFRIYHEIWDRHGFIKMFWTIMTENQVRVHLLSLENGERSLTNILHLAEILHQEAVERDLNMTALLEYLLDRMAGDQTKNVEHQLRLESDADRVKIVTIHKAKGLEYPVVFCPFTWEGTRLSSPDSCIFHLRKGKTAKTELIFDAGSPQLKEHLQLARQEELAENLRLLYVALTRAIHRCYMVWGPFKDAETSAPAYLMHQGPTGTHQGSHNDLLAHAASRYRDLSVEEMRQDLQDLAEASSGSITIQPCPAAIKINNFQPAVDEMEPLLARDFIGTVASDWKISSFSSLIADRTAPAGILAEVQEAIAGRDDYPYERKIMEESASPVEKKRDIFSFPRGPGPGTLLHDLLEKIDFSRITTDGTENLVRQKLQQYGYDPAWSPILAQMLLDLANVSLHAGIPGLRLSDIPASSCLHELEFYFPIRRITTADLKSIFRAMTSVNRTNEFVDAIEDHIDRLTFSPAKGFMRGFIDLVFEFHGKFYLVDWKSNYLGSTANEYHKERLTEVMVSGYYFLQYHLYCLALHFYLASRLSGYDYTTHFGGVFYIYLRGVNHRLGPDYGIFHELPAYSMIKNLETKLITGWNNL